MAILLYIIVSAGFLAAENFFPQQSDTLNYTHVFFQWPQMTSNTQYTFNISSLDDNNTWSTTTHINALILDEFLDWGQSYEWEVCYSTFFGNECLTPLSFTINQLPDYYPNQNDVFTDNKDKYYSGLNMMAIREIGTSIVFDMDGEPVWFFDIDQFDEDTFYANEILPNGNIVAYSMIPSPSGYGYEIDLDGNVIFKTETYGHHHEFIKSSKNTYFGMINDKVYEENHCEDPINEYVDWEGDNFVEYDEDGNLIWEWSTLDHINHNDFNPLFCSSTNPNLVDWTHANSVVYDVESNSVIISLRNISRIIKVDYETGNIIWYIGQEEFMSDSIDIDIDFEFSSQHSLRMTDEGNIIFFANNTYFNPQQSKCIEFSVDQSNSIFTSEWEYIIPESLFTHVRGECERLENGNTLISTGTKGQLLEVTDEGEIVWHYSSKTDGNRTNIVRNERIPSLYPLAFNAFLENYHEGELTAFDNNIQILITNLGWLDDEFHVEIYLDNDLVGSASLAVGKNSYDWALVSIPGEILEDQVYIIKVYPSKATDETMELQAFIKNKEIPKNNISISSIFPNPFNSTIYLQYSIPEKSFVEVVVYNVKGQKIESLFAGSKDPGYYSVKWTPKEFSSGVYFLRVSSDKHSQFQKVTLVK
ncbi:MAG: aryl-sulfate sulfotransferase [Candidatus Marinimicrobia bacterium]|jgi:hypothetical protein|nr:aryl-sulfate sulfotransferase [Candidatus Neomarinimicrobiota bacterium]MDP7437413.1 aryl-sulfate sulfotransferase [Candidatus Neomarinimicrobiota bacterium]HJL75101.1 aryl-sulfate sulfotransferase [Candidatus Neomarinimicrobiota bacterium]|tara:strand:+ start:5531 stop:7465 length:1935 start_codon:yes stop_codon:yes gene_type:complete